MDKKLIKASGLMLALNEHYLSHLIRLYKAFDGDMELCVVLGEIGHYNTRHLFKDKGTHEMDIEELRKSYTGCNATSISMSSGIPRETVRRKIRKLEEMGYVVIDDKKQMSITDLPRVHLGEFTKETLRLFISFTQELQKDDLI